MFISGFAKGLLKNQIDGVKFYRNSSLFL